MMNFDVFLNRRERESQWPLQLTKMGNNPVPAIYRCGIIMYILFLQLYYTSCPLCGLAKVISAVFQNKPRENQYVQKDWNNSRGCFIDNGIQTNE
jgi:hypothetical protein